MSEIEVEVREFELQLGAIHEQARACVTRFREADADVQYLLAERLGSLGSVIIPDLQLILEDSAASATLHYLAA